MNIAPLISRRSVRGIEARAGLESFAHGMCAALGLPAVTVTWRPISTAAISQSGQMLLADIGDGTEVTGQTVARYAGFILHELLHRAYTDFGARDRRPYVDRLHNALEDAWIERRAIRSGLTGNVQGLLHALLRGLLADVPADIKWNDPAQFPFSLAVYTRGYGVTVPVPRRLMPIWKEAAARIDGCASSHDTLALAQWVFDQIQQQDQQQDDQPDQGDDQQQPDQGQDQGDDQQGDQGGDEQTGDQGDQSGQGDDQGDDQGNQGQDKGQGKGQPGEPEDAGEPAYTPSERTDAREVEPRMEADDAAPGGAYSRDSALRQTPAPTIKAPLWAEDARVPARLRHEVKSLFQNTAREWREGGFRSGTLHRPALAKVGTGSADVFARRMSEDGVDSAVGIMLDISSSMFPSCVCVSRNSTSHWSRGGQDIKREIEWSAINTAVGTCLALLETLQQAQADTLVLGFGEDSYLLKDWNQQWRKVAPALRSVGHEGNTNDYRCARWLTESLMRHPAERKVLIAITDGDGNKWETAAQMKAAQALGIRVIGIGIGHDVRPVYGPDSVRIDTLADLGRVAFSKMKAAA